MAINLDFFQPQGYRRTQEGGQYNPEKAADLASEMNAQFSDYQRRQQNYLNSIERRFDSEERAQKAESYIANQDIKEMEALSKFSSTLVDRLGKVKGALNDQEKEAGMAEYYQYGVSAEEQAEFDEGKAALIASHDQIEDAAAKAEKNGASYNSTYRLRQLSGYKALGYAEAMAGDLGQRWPGILSEQLATNTQVITLADGEQFQINQAGNDPAKVAAATAAIRAQLMRDTGLLDMNPAMLEKSLFQPMRRAEAAVMNQASTKFKAEKQKEAQLEANNEALMGIRTGNVQAMQVALRDLTRAGGVEASTARKDTFKMWMEAIQANPEAAATMETFLKSPVPGQGGKTYEEVYASEIVLAEKEMTAAKQQALENMEAQEQLSADQDARKILETLRADPNQEQHLETYMEEFYQKHGTKEVPDFLKNYIENGTLKSRDLREQEAAIENLVQTDQLSIAELTSGKYSPEIVQKYMKDAEQADRRNAPARNAAAQKYGKIVEKHVLGKADLSATDGSNASVGLAVIQAQGLVERQYRLLTQDPANAGKSPDELYSMATQSVVEQIDDDIKEGKGMFAMQGLGGQARFMYFDRGVTSQNAVDAAQDMMRRRTETVVKGGLGALQNNTNDLFSKEEAQRISDPSNLDPNVIAQVSHLVATMNQQGIPVTIDQATQMILDHHGLKSQRPFEREDLYQDVAINQGLLAKLNQPTNSRVNYVSAQGQLPPAVIRQGVQGGKDVIQAAQSFGFPPAIAPLVAAQWALESGYGKHTSGKNNYFGIKDFSGGGTARATTEYSGVPTMANFRDYDSATGSVKDYVELLKDPRYAAVLSAKTPYEAAKAVKAAGYATDPNYVNKLVSVMETMGFNPHKSHESQQLTPSPWSKTSLMSPLAQKYVYSIGSKGYGSTGPHLDVKPVQSGGVYGDAGQRITEQELDQYVLVENAEGKQVPLSQGTITTDDDAGHRARGSYGHDYATPSGKSGQKVFLTGGAKIVENWTDNSARGQGSDRLVIELPNGKRYAFVHGTAVAQ